MPNARSAKSEERLKRQKGALMAGLVAMIAVSMIWSTVAFQAWIDVLRRDNEAEMIFRAEEIVRAIQRYRKDHGGQGPRKMEQLLEPSPKRSYYIRREYEDPLVPDGKWGLLFMGPGGQIIDPNAAPIPGVVNPGIGGLNNTTQNQGTPGQGVSGNQSPTGAGQLGGIANPTQGGGEDTGLPIAGVRTLSKDQPFRVYKGESDYTKWVFTYLDIDASAVGRDGERRGGPGAGQRGPGNRGPGAGQRGPGNRGPGNRGPGSQSRRDNRN